MRTFPSISSSILPKAVAVALLGGFGLLTGCGIGAIATDSTSSATGVQTALNISGTVHGGSQAISGATVNLMQTGTGGYGSGATLLATTTTNSSGGFNFGNDVTSGTGVTPVTYYSYSPCSSNATGPYIYVTATGGNPVNNGSASQYANGNITLVDMLGNCDAVSSATKIGINEATTIAAAYTLGNFATDTSGSVSIGAPGSNLQGLADAVANAQLLVTAQGLPNASTSTVELPTAMLDQLANALSSCVNSSPASSGSTSSSCSTLFGYTTPPVTSPTAPTDTFQAALNMAKYPGQNVASILDLVTGTGAPFQPTVSQVSVTATTAPNDLTLGIAYPNTTQATSAGNSPVAITIDKLDNVWVIGGSSGTTTSNYNYLSQLSSSSTGGVYSNPLGSTQPLDGTHQLRNGRFDKSGNLWLTNVIKSTAGGVIELPKNGTSVSLTGAVEYDYGIAALDPNSYDLAVDASNNVFTASYGAQGNCTVATSATECYYVEFPAGSSTPYTATDIFGSTTSMPPTASVQPTPTVRGMAADDVATSAGLGNIWTANYGVFGGGSGGGTSVEVLTPSTGALTTITIGTVADAPFAIALDKTGGAYVDTTNTAATSALYYVPQGTGHPGTTSTGAATPTINATVSSSVSVTGNTGTTGTNATSPTLPNILTSSSSPASTASSPLAVGGLNGPGYVVLDGAGNVWIANYTYGSLVEYSPSQSGYLSPFYGFSPSVTVPAQTLTVTNVTLSTNGTANIYYTGDTAINGQQVTFSGFPAGNYAFLNGNTYTISSTSFNYFTIPDGGQSKISETAVSGTATIPTTTQVVFQCGPYVTTSTTTTCTTVGNATSRNNGIGIDRAGTVWTLGTNGTLVGLLGTAAPTDPVLADGASGTLP